MVAPLISRRHCEGAGDGAEHCRALRLRKYAHRVGGSASIEGRA